MAKERWGTFSVEHHRFIAALVPDILCFDKLIFPYPENNEERAYWEKKLETEDHDIELGPVAVFHHVHKRVFVPARQ